MKVNTGDTDREIILDFDDIHEYEAFFGEVEKEGCFILKNLSLPQNPLIRARAAGSSRSRKIKPTRIVEREGDFEIWLQESTPRQPPPAPPLAEEKKPEPEKTLVEEEVHYRTLAEKVRALPVSERVTLALKADLAERRILMQENNIKINEFLLRNPRLTEGEIAWMARNATSPVQTILTILHNKGWMNMESVRTGILTNPKTPAAMVLDMIPMLNASDLMKMNNARYLREDVKNAVVKEMKKRGLRVKRDMENY